MQENNPIQAVPEIQPVTTSNIQQPKTSNFLVVLLSILLVISVSISGFFAYQTQKLVRELQGNKNMEEVVETTEPIATESSEVDPTASWKTYTNKALGFEIKYPETWRNQVLDNGILFGPVEIGEDLIVGVSYFEKSTNSLSSIINEIGKQFSDRKVVQETILVKPKNIQAEKITVTTPSYPDWYSVTVLYTNPTHYITVSNGAMKDVNLPFNRGVPSDFTFEKFYSTFKFIN